MTKKLQTPPEIRVARLEDAEALHPIIHQAYRTDAGWTNEGHLVGGERISLTELKDLIKKKIDPILVAVLDSDEIVGCISAESSRAHAYLGLPENSALIGLFAVSPTHQSRGIGSALFSAIQRHVKREWSWCEWAILWVIKQRTDLQKWYERIGFEWSGEMKDFVFPNKALQSDVKFKVYSKRLAAD